jgi:hypothetical protein
MYVRVNSPWFSAQVWKSEDYASATAVNGTVFGAWGMHACMYECIYLCIFRLYTMYTALSLYVYTARCLAPGVCMHACACEFMYSCVCVCIFGLYTMYTSLSLCVYMYVCVCVCSDFSRIMYVSVQCVYVYT